MHAETEPTTVSDDYDSPWKEAIEHHFADFMAFYFPHAVNQAVDVGSKRWMRAIVSAITSRAHSVS